MKKTIILSLFAAFFLLNPESSSAQGWCQDRKAIWSLGVGGTQGFVPGWRGYYYDQYRYTWVTAPGMFFNFSGDFRVHRYVSLGFQTGVVFYFYRHAPAVGIPIVFRPQFHILEATTASVKDKLDVYAGLSIGGGPSFPVVSDGVAYGILYAGPHAGVRYWFSPKAAVFGEVGWGATFLNAGFTF